MKITATHTKTVYDKLGNAEITFSIQNNYFKQLASELKEDVPYRLEIKEIKGKRTLLQNAYMWSLLHELERVTGELAHDWYIKALEQANASYEYIMLVPEAEQAIRDVFRAIKYHSKREVNGKEVNVYKCFHGSSKFTKEEMAKLLDVVMVYCYEHEIDAEAHKYEWEENK